MPRAHVAGDGIKSPPSPSIEVPTLTKLSICSLLVIMSVLSTLRRIDSATVSLSTMPSTTYFIAPLLEISATTVNRDDIYNALPRTTTSFGDILPSSPMRLGGNLYSGQLHQTLAQCNNSSAPMDGPGSWYCGSCGDGPYGEWQASCQVCYHNKCSCCKEEER